MNATDTILEEVRMLGPYDRLVRLKEAMLDEPRMMSIEQARIITASYRRHSNESRALRRAWALHDSLAEMTIRIDPRELVVGNRSREVRGGIVFPEGGIAWVAEELDTLPTRAQDPFGVRPEDSTTFLQEILPFWHGQTLEDIVAERHGEAIRKIKSVVKINQTDHAQGHISPDVASWLHHGPQGLRDSISSGGEFGRSATIALDGAIMFMRRYGDLACELAGRDGFDSREMMAIADRCHSLAEQPPQTFADAIQSVWFLFVILQMESNASSFSPGRMDQYLLPYLEHDLAAGMTTLDEAQELIGALWLKFNQIVYMRNASSAQYFAGFPIGFNVAIGGMNRAGDDATNVLSYMFLRAQELIGLPQPNLSARVWSRSPDAFVDYCARVIGLGSGMPQIVSDESIIPSLMRQGISEQDARDYAVVGCVELSTQGNNLGWSDAAMFNLVKVLELAVNDGVCMLTGKRLGPATGLLTDFSTFDDFLDAYERQFDHFFDAMIPLCDAIDRLHAEVLPSPFLSTVIDGCLEKELDVTAGGARYNLSGIQAIQVANLADGLAVLKQLVFEEHSVSSAELLEALRSDWVGNESLRSRVISHVPKYGNDIEWVDELGAAWARRFAERLREYTNARGGPYHMGLYTVSAHVPMGRNVAATPDGRHNQEPLADGGMSAMYGRDLAGPTALLRSVSRISSLDASNGTLLNMKFLPRMFEEPREREKFVAMLRALGTLRIHHAQFNVVDRETLLAARAHPEEHRNLTIRVAGYTAYFTELAPDLQEEIIARTTYGSAG